MGIEITAAEFAPDDWSRYEHRLKAGLCALRELVDSDQLLQAERLVGVEVEACLTDAHGTAAPINAPLLERLQPGPFQAELAKFNLEFTLGPYPAEGGCLRRLRAALEARLVATQAAAAALGGQAVLIGVLPTIRACDVTEQNISASARYRALNAALCAARGERFRIRIDGAESLRADADSILFEAACTALQLHAQVAEPDSARYWNAAGALSAPLLAAAANAPFFLCRQLHHETRIELFRQATDTRTQELLRRGARPRVWFGERWLAHSLYELFEENVRYFPPLLPVCAEEDPGEVLASGGVPALSELVLHNSTIWRWNRPVYQVTDGRPHFRIENRVLPAGPSASDSVANLALCLGLLAGLADADRPVWEELSFATAEANFTAAARHGLGARLDWPGVGAAVPVTSLLLRHLLPIAHEGLRAQRFDAADIDHYLGIIEERVETGRNGAAWQIGVHRRLLDRHRLSRVEAARELMRRYTACAHSGEPVHTWPLDGP